MSGLITSKCTVQALRGLSARCGSLLHSIKCADMMRTTVFHHTSHKSTGELNPEYAFYPRCAIAMPPLVGEVPRVVSQSKVCDPVIPFVTINVVDYERNWFAVGQQPCEPVGHEPGAIYVDGKVAISSRGTRKSASISRIPPGTLSRAAEVVRWPDAPLEYSAIRTVIEALADILAIWQRLSSHLILLPGSLVRRAVAWQASPFSAGAIS